MNKNKQKKTITTITHEHKQTKENNNNDYAWTKGTEQHQQKKTIKNKSIWLVPQTDTNARGFWLV